MGVRIIIDISDELVEEIVKSIMENFPEASTGNSLKCEGWIYEKWMFDFSDMEEGKIYELDKEKLLAAFPFLFTDKWPKGLTRPPCSSNKLDWDGWLCSCDAGDFDAYVQLAIFGEIIYG